MITGITYFFKGLPGSLFKSCTPAYHTVAWYWNSVPISDESLWVLFRNHHIEKIVISKSSSDSHPPDDFWENVERVAKHRVDKALTEVKKIFSGDYDSYPTTSLENLKHIGINQLASEVLEIASEDL